jgi:hypothetical protein
MLGGNGTPDKYNDQRASSLYCERFVENNAHVLTGRGAEVRLERKAFVIVL